MIGNTSNKDIIRFSRSMSQDLSQIHERAREDFTEFQLIGEGSISKVFSAKSKRDQQKYAVKILNNKCSTYLRAPKQAWDSFMKEIHYLAHMGDHPNVMPILDFDYDLEVEQAYYVMPYLESLRLLRTEKLKLQALRKEPLLDITKLISDCSCAIQYAFQKESISHDNLRLDNVFYSQTDEKFVVTDWRGLPKKLQMTPRSGSKSVFVAPELSDPLRSFPKNSQPLKGDVYSLAILAAEASGINLPSVEAKSDTSQQMQESFIPAVIKLLQTNGTEPAAIDMFKKMTIINPDQRCSMLSLNPTTFDDPERLKRSVFNKFAGRIRNVQANYLKRWRNKVEKQKLLEKGITFAKVLIACTNNIDHLLLQAFEKWRENTQAQSFLERTLEEAHPSSQTQRGLEILAKCRARVLSRALYKLRFNSTLLNGVLVPPDKRRFLVVIRCLRRSLREYLLRWKQAAPAYSKGGKSLPGSSGSSSPVGNNINTLALTLRKTFTKKYIEGFSAIKQNMNRFKLLKICIGRMNEAVKSKLFIAMELWKGHSSIKNFQSMHKLLELENVIRNHARKMLMSAFHKIKTHGVVDYQKSYLQAIWKWKLSHCEAKYYVRQDVFVKRARALAQLIATLEFKAKDSLRTGFDRLYTHKLRKPMDKSFQLKYFAMIIKNKMRKSLWELKEAKVTIERDQGERKQTLMQAAGRAGKILARRVSCEQAKWFYRWREFLIEEQHLEDKGRLVENRLIRIQKTQALSDWKQMLIRAERGQKQRLQGMLLLKALVNYRLRLAKTCFNTIKKHFAENIMVREEKKSKGVEKLFYFLWSRFQNNKRIAFEGISNRSDLRQQRKKILLVNKLIHLRRLTEHVAIHESFMIWRNSYRNFNPWFKKATQRLTKLSRINYQVAFWRLIGSVNVEGAHLSEAKAKSMKGLVAVLKKQYERTLSCAFWKIESHNEHFTADQTFISEEGRGRGLSSSAKKSRGTSKSPDMTLEDLKTLSHRYERGRQEVLKNLLDKYAAEELNSKRVLHVWKKNAGLRFSSTMSTTAPSRDISFFSRVGNLEVLIKRLERLISLTKRSAFDALASHACK